MAKVYMTCGRICTGKSTYARKLRHEHNAAVLSVDEITLALFGGGAGEMHDTYVGRLEKYLFEKSVELIEEGINVVLEWGFWTARERCEAREFYRSRGIETELHYLDIPDEEWHRRIEKRNALVREGSTSAYFIDEGLAAKADALFEPPADDEIDVRITE